MTRSLTAVIFFSLVIPVALYAQNNRYWSQNFNDESSMLAGAVVGGDAGVASIYYNPANIAEITDAKLSFSVSLFSVSMYNLKNAVGDGLNLGKARFIAQPRFVSYLVDFKENNRLSLELAFMNVANSQIRMAQSKDKTMDIIKSMPGDERYHASYILDNNYRDDYAGAGLSYEIRDNLWMGVSGLISVKTVRSSRDLDIEAIPLTDSVLLQNINVPTYDASYQEYDEVRFNNFSMIWKLGMAYHIRNMRLGLNLTFPSVNLFSGGTSVNRLVKQNNITAPDGTGFLPDYTFVGYERKKDVDVRCRTPFAVAAGATFKSPQVPDKSFFLSVEYFSSLPVHDIVQGGGYPYRMPADIPNLDSASWMVYRSGARDLINFAVGYRWYISDDLLLLAGFKSDFSFLKGVPLEGNRVDNFSINVYHLTGGARIKIKNNMILCGIQYSFGYDSDRKQLINLSDPVEFNETEMLPLQGTRQDNMRVMYNNISFFLGASFNFARQPN